MVKKRARIIAIRRVFSHSYLQWRGNIFIAIYSRSKGLFGLVNSGVGYILWYRMRPLERGLRIRSRWLFYRLLPLTDLVVFMSKDPIYKVIFHNLDQVYEIYARAIYQSEMYGFVEVEEFVFGERTQLVVDPGEEKLKGEFAGVKRSFIPMHSIIRIDEVEKEGVVKVLEVKGDKVAQFPYQAPIPLPEK